MRLSEKIDFKKYILFSLILFAAFLPFFHNPTEIKILIVTYIAVLLNQFMLVMAVQDLIEPMARGEKVENGWVVFLFIGKAVVLILGLIYGVQIIGNRIIIPVLFYVCQIFVLIFSSKRRILTK